MIDITAKPRPSLAGFFCVQGLATAMAILPRARLDSDRAIASLISASG
jgi:hypothetical protein